MMVTLKDIENEAAFVQHLIALANPTGRLRSATPWAADGRFHVTAAGAKIAEFRHEADRDVALYFTNVHPGMIAMLRSFGNAFDFIVRSTEDVGLKSYATNQAELCRNYAQLFCNLGKPVVIDEAPEHGMDGKE